MKLYDPACHELADHFLGDDDVSPAENELRIQSLAGAIQQAVEDWCAAEEATLLDARFTPSAEGTGIGSATDPSSSSTAGPR